MLLFSKDCIGKIVAGYGFEIDKACPVKDMLIKRDVPVSLELLNDLPAFLDRFIKDETFRTLAVNNVDVISKVIENNLYFRMIAR